MVKTRSVEEICLKCFNPFVRDGRCTACGCDEETMKTKKYEEVLGPGIILRGRYLIGETLGCGGFGITYAGFDLQEQRRIAIKECFLYNICERADDEKSVALKDKEYEQEYRESTERFLKEIQLLKENRDNPVIIQVFDVFQENSTVYYVMEYLAGQDLGHYIKETEKQISWKELSKYMEPVFLAVISLHRFNILHRDISPDNIFLCNNGQVRLIDFGSARVGLLDKSHVLDAAKKGYAPIEQYNDRMEQGTWTDVYSLAATIYRCLTGLTVNAATDRIRKDELQRPSVYAKNIPEHVDKVLMRALEVEPSYRYQSVAEFKRALYPDNQTEPLADRIVKESVSTEEENREKNVRLLGLSGYFEGQEFLLDKKINVGRMISACDILFPADTPGVSSIHCNIYFDETKQLCVFRDLHSTYGTKELSGKQMLQGVDIYLDDGDGFIIGEDHVFAVLFY